MRVAGQRWKDFKTRLVRDFINKEHSKYTSPTQLYDFLTEEQWKKFKKERETEAFKVCIMSQFLFMFYTELKD